MASPPVARHERASSMALSVPLDGDQRELWPCQAPCREPSRVRSERRMLLLEYALPFLRLVLLLKRTLRLKLALGVCG